MFLQTVARIQRRSSNIIIMSTTVITLLGTNSSGA